MIRKQSKKRAVQNREYSKLRKEYLEGHPICEVRLGNCTNQATNIHHQRGRIGDLLTDTTYFLACCFSCHQWIENNPTESKKRGYSISRLSI